MKAIVHDRYGEADVLSFTDVDQPAPADDEVLVRVRAAGVDPGVWHLMAGLPYPVRLVSGLRKPKTRIRGMDFAGTVEAAGKNVSLKPGDEVYGTCEGAFGEYARAKADRVAPKPANLTFDQAAVVPISATTALQALRDRANVQSGQKVLVIGAAGGVGSFAVQLAKAFDAHVTGVCSTAKTELVKKIGADTVIDYTRQDVTGTYDVILDTAGNRTLSRLRGMLTPTGTVVFVGGEGGGKWGGGNGRVLAATLINPFVRQNLRGLLALVRTHDLLALTEFVESGRVRPVIDRTFAFADAAEAVRYVHNGHAAGKIVVTV